MPVVINEGIDDPLVWENCPSFVGGQVSFAKASSLNAVQSALLQNCYIHITGEIRKRRGTRNLEDGFVATQGQRVQKLHRWKTPTQNKLLAYSGGKVYEFDEGTNMWTLYFDAAVADIDELISVAQLSDNLWWTDSAKNAVRRWDGAAVTSVAGSPDATILISFTNRLIAAGVALVPHGVYFSDILDGTTWPGISALQIGSEGDPIIALYGWSKSSVLVFKELSTHIIQAVPTLTVANFPVEVIHNKVGCLAKRSIAQVGQDVFFLSRSGVMTVQKQIATDNNVIPVPLSQEVQDVLFAVQWEYAHKSCAIYYNNHYILAVPVFSTEPDVALVYCNLTHTWAGVWLGITATDFIEQPHLGRTRLITGNHVGETREALDYLLDTEEDWTTFTDGLGSLTLPFTIPASFGMADPVVSIVRTGAKQFNEQVSPKTGWYVEIEFFAKDGDIEVYAILDGDNSVLLDEGSFSFSVQHPVLPLTLPFQLGSPKWRKKNFPLHNLGQFREIQIEVRGTRGNMILRSITLSAYIDTVLTNQN